MKKTVLLVVLCLLTLTQNAWAQKEEEEIVETAEVMPQYPGGMDLLFQYLAKNLKYPPKALQCNVSGTIICRFVVQHTGAISNVSILQSIKKPELTELEKTAMSKKELKERKKQLELSEEAIKDMEKECIRVVSSMPTWTPGYSKGKQVNCWFTLPVKFKLQ